jgi:hypothetical protein
LREVMDGAYWFSLFWEIIPMFLEGW